MNDRDELADNITGWAIGTGYYSQQIGYEEAQEIADGLIALGYRKTTAAEWAVRYDRTRFVVDLVHGEADARDMCERFRAEGIPSTVVTRKVTEWEEA